MHASREANPRSAAIVLPALLLTFVAGLFPLTADYVLFHPDERHYADAGIRMLQTGEYLTPRTADGQLRLKKPILPYWCVAAGYHAVGISPLGARLGFLIAGAAVVGLSWWGAMIAFDSRRAACFAAVAAMSQPALLISVPRSVPDVCLALGIQLSVCGFLLILRTGRTTAAGLLAAFGGGALAVLSKGLPAAAFLGYALLFMAWRSPALLRRDWRHWGLAAAACLAVGGSWFVLMAGLHSEELALQFTRDQLGPNRFAAHLWQPVVQLPLCVVLLLSMSGPWLIAGAPELRAPQSRARFLEQPAVMLLLGWAAFYCALAATINHVTPRYLLPAAAPLSIVVGGLLSQADPAQLQRRLWRALLVIGWAVGASIVVTGLLFADRPARVLLCGCLMAVGGSIVLHRVRHWTAITQALSIAVVIHAVLCGAGIGISAWRSAGIGGQVRNHPQLQDRQTPPGRIVFDGEAAHATQIRVALGGRMPVLAESSVDRIAPADVLVLDESRAAARDLSMYEVTLVPGGYRKLDANEVVQSLLTGELTELLQRRERRFVIATPRSTAAEPTQTAAAPPPHNVR